MFSWECQCINSDLERSGEGSIELVAWGDFFLWLLSVNTLEQWSVEEWDISLT